MSDVEQAKTRLLSYAAMLRSVAGQIETDVKSLSDTKEHRVEKDASAASTASTAQQAAQKSATAAASNDIEVMADKSIEGKCHYFSSKI